MISEIPDGDEFADDCPLRQPYLAPDPGAGLDGGL